MAASLCSRCQHLEIIAYLHTSAILPPKGKFIAAVEDFSHASCSLCTLIRAIKDQAAFTDSQQLLWSFSLGTLRGSEGDNELSSWSNIFLGIVPDKQPRAMRDICLDSGVIATPTGKDCDGRHGSWRVHRVKKHHANWTQLKHWLKCCEETHGSNCNFHSRKAETQALKCLDCRQGKLVQIGIQKRYAALSYVWGDSKQKHGQSLRMTNTDNVFIELLPKVIRDAVAIVLRLGERYLWVDKLCIDEDDHVKKREQIHGMHDIYGQAFITIIPADCKNAYQPIPGVSAVRESQLEAEIGQLSLVTTSGHLGSKISSTVWMTRGWTYQEYVFSKRCLFFMNDQVHFLCRKFYCNESLDRSPQKLEFEQFSKQSLIMDVDVLAKSSPKLRRSKYLTQKEWTRLPDPFQEFRYRLRDYRTRKLTFDEDSLSAFQGMISSMPFSCVYGVPIALHYLSQKTFIACNMGFARGLFWESEICGPSQRIEAYPSWSWAGWKLSLADADEANESANLIVNDSYASMDSATFMSQFWVGHKDGQLLDLAYVAQSSAELDQPSHLLVCTGLVTPIYLRCKQCDHVSHLCQHKPWLREILGVSDSRPVFHWNPDLDERGQSSPGQLYGFVLYTTFSREAVKERDAAACMLILKQQSDACFVRIGSCRLSFDDLEVAIRESSEQVFYLR